MVELLAQNYGDQVVFIEYNSQSTASLDRMDRWWAADGGNQANLPLTMVDSGYRIHSGFTTIERSYAEHEAMILDALERPPQADVSASWVRVGDTARVQVQVTNQSDAALGYDNYAAVHAIIYEENFIQYTGRFMRAHIARPIEMLEDNETAQYTLTTGNLAGVDWSKLRMIALVDYLTPEGIFDMLQAAYASSAPEVTPASLIFYAPLGGPAPAPQSLSISGPAGVGWRVSESAAWMQITATSGSIPAQPTVSITTDGLSQGIYSQKILFTAGAVTQEVTVLLAVGNILWNQIPLVIGN